MVSYFFYPYYFGPYRSYPRKFYHRNSRQPNYYWNTAYFHQDKRQLDPAFQKIWGALQKDLEPVYEKLMEYNMNRVTARFFVQQMVIFAMQHAANVSGSINQRVNQLWTLFAEESIWLMGLLAAYRISRQEIERFVRQVFGLTLANMDYSPEQDWIG